MAWSLLHVSQEDINGEIARIMEKSMENANISVTPKQNAKAIAGFRQKTVTILLFCPYFLFSADSMFLYVTVLPISGLTLAV